MSLQKPHIFSGFFATNFMQQLSNILSIQASSKLLVFGGPYSNLHALLAMRAKAQALGFSPEQIICTGDVVGYCAFPLETVQEMMDWGVHCISGNVEEQLRNGAEDCGCDFTDGSRCDVFSQQWYPYAQSKLSRKAIDWMNTLPDALRFEFGGQSWGVLHGGMENRSEFIFDSSPWGQKAIEMQRLEVQNILAGHCGIPFHSRQNDQHWINAGVIGMPANDAQTETWFAALEVTDDGVKCDFHALEYDHLAAAKAMRNEGLPKPYALTLETGIWDNCEILPQAETKAQGKAILFG